MSLKPTLQSTVYTSLNTTNMYFNMQISGLTQPPNFCSATLLTIMGRSLVVLRLAMDSGNQRTHMTSHTRQAFNLTSSRSQYTCTCMCMMTFGTATKTDSDSKDIRFGRKKVDGELLEVTALAEPLISQSLSCQLFSKFGEHYRHLADLQLADSADTHDCLEVELLIELNYYWNLVTGEVRNGAN